MEYVFGHLIGDFFFQSGLMADTKYKKGWYGVLWCSIHVLIYTITVSVLVGNFQGTFLLAVAIPHWVIDRYSVAYCWMSIISRAHLLTSDNPTKIAFGTIIYVVIDQTFHVGCLYLLYLNFQ